MTGEVVEFISTFNFVGTWRGGRVVYGSGLENQRVFTGTVGSNPTLSALKSQSLTGFFRI